MAGVPVLLVENLVKDYGAVHAVRGVSLAVQRGTVFGFLGPNGAGKSTTIRCILGLIRPTAGRIEVLGMDVTTRGVEARRRMAYVPGELRLPDRLTGAEFIRSLGRLRGGMDERRLGVVRDRLAVELDRPMRTLSTGNRRKIGLLIAFASAPDVLVLDEPTNGLDPLMQHEFLALVRETAAAGATVFLSSHILSEVQRAAEHVAVLRAGVVIAEGTVESLRGHARQRIDAWFQADAPAAELATLGLRDLRIEGRHVTATSTGTVQPLIDLLARHPVASLQIEEPDLEEAFLDLYSEPAAPAGPAATGEAAVAPGTAGGRGST